VAAWEAIRALFTRASRSMIGGLQNYLWRFVETRLRGFGYK